MKKMFIPVIVLIVILLIVAGIFLYERAHAALYEEPETYMQISMAEAEKVFESDIPKKT